jgi:hypothetical protein
MVIGGVIPPRPSTLLTAVPARPTTVGLDDTDSPSRPPHPTSASVPQRSPCASPTTTRAQLASRTMSQGRPTSVGGPDVLGDVPSRPSFSRHTMPTSPQHAPRSSPSPPSRSPTSPHYHDPQFPRTAASRAGTAIGSTHTEARAPVAVDALTDVDARKLAEENLRLRKRLHELEELTRIPAAPATTASASRPPTTDWRGFSKPKIDEEALSAKASVMVLLSVGGWWTELGGRKGQPNCVYCSAESCFACSFLAHSGVGDGAS